MRLLYDWQGFALTDRWERIVGGPEQVAAWEARGFRSFTVPASGEDVSIPWAFAANCRTFPATPQPRCRTTVVHGEHDEVVPWRCSEAFVARAAAARRLVLLDDDHALTAPSSV
jgi:uncharacterized protein